MRAVSFPLACLLCASNGLILHNTRGRLTDDPQKWEDSQLLVDVRQSRTNRGGLYTSCQALVRLLRAFNPTAAWQGRAAAWQGRPAAWQGIAATGQGAAAAWQGTGVGLGHRPSHSGKRARIPLARVEFHEEAEGEGFYYEGPRPVDFDAHGVPLPLQDRDEDDEVMQVLRAAASGGLGKKLNNTGMVAHSPVCLTYSRRDLEEFGHEGKYNYYLADVEVSHGYPTEGGDPTTEFTTVHRLQFTWQLMRVCARIRRAPWYLIDPSDFATETLRFICERTPVDLCDPEWECRAGAENVPFTPDYMPGRPLFEWYPDLYKYIADTLLPDWPHLPQPDPDLHERAIRNYREWYQIDDDVDVTIDHVNCSKISIEEWGDMHLLPDLANQSVEGGMGGQDLEYGSDVFFAVTQIGDYTGLHIDKFGDGKWWERKFK